VVQTIEIQNGLVSLVDRTVQYQVPMEQWLDKIEKRNPLFTPTLPLGTRSVYWDQTDLNNQKFVVLVEQQPQIIRMDFLGTIHTLSIPYTRFFFYCTTNNPANTLSWHMVDYRVFWSNKQYNDPAARDMIPAMLPNVYGDGRICFGSTGANAEQSLAQRINQTANEFYVSMFNRDLTIRRPNGSRSWTPWERMTVKDPTGWMKWTDWNSNSGQRFHSMDGLVADLGIGHSVMAARLEPMISADPIPEVPMGATFGRISEWLDGMTTDQRARLAYSIDRDRSMHNDRYELDAVLATGTDDDEDGE
jgi:hypothetical protein